MTPINLRQRTIVALSLLFMALIGFKVFYLKYTPAMIIPTSGYQVDIFMQIEDYTEKVRVISALPISNFRQAIFNEMVDTTAFNFVNRSKNGNRFGWWETASPSGRLGFSYSFCGKAQKVVCELPDSLPHVASYDDTLKRFLNATKMAQADSPPIKNVLAELQLGKNSNVVHAVKKIYDFTAHKIKTAALSSKMDALTTLQLGEANSSGKSQLFIAMTRALGIPSRLVGGLNLKSGKKGVIHHWVEVYLGNQWVPFDPANRRFAELPEDYLMVYYGDEIFFQHSSSASFDYAFNIKRRLFPKDNDSSILAKYSLNIMNMWPLFQRGGLSLDLLRIILMIPVGAIVTIIFRNVIGLETFGAFLPVLIATAFRETGLFWGLMIFVTIIFLGAKLSAVLHRLRILYAPRLTIILVYVVSTLLLISAFGMKYANVSLGGAALFPLAIMAITIERFALLAEEAGLRKASTLFFNTIVTVVFCYLVINSLFLQTVVLAFPETMLLVVSASIYLGAWKGLRLKEVIRFRKLLFDNNQLVRL